MNDNKENPSSAQGRDESKEALDLLFELLDESSDINSEESKEQDNAENESIEVRERKQNIKEREKYAEQFIRLARNWLIFIGFVIISNGLDCDVPHFSFSVNDTVILALLGTSLVNILTPAVLVARYLFNPSRKNLS